jgi:hypothetical protein
VGVIVDEEDEEGVDDDWAGRRGEVPRDMIAKAHPLQMDEARCGYGTEGTMSLDQRILEGPVVHRVRSFEVRSGRLPVVANVRRLIFPYARSQEQRTPCVVNVIFKLDPGDKTA